MLVLQLHTANVLAASGGMKSGTDLYSEIDDKRQQLEERNNSYRVRL